MRNERPVAKTGLDIIGDKWLHKVSHKDSVYKYIAGFILNWIKLPFQLVLFPKPVILPPEVKKLDPANMILTPDNITAYYSNNTTMDGHSHDTDNQFIRHVMYMFLGNKEMESHVFAAASRFAGSNLSGGQNLTNGVSWMDGTAHYHGDNVSTETLAVSLLLANSANKATFEIMVSKMLSNGGYFYYLSNPGGKKSQAYEKALKEANYDRLEVKMENPRTNIFPGFSKNDAAIVALAALSMGQSLKLKRLFKLYYYLFGYGLKARFSSNSLEVITSLYVLFKVTKEEKYEKILRSKFQAEGKIDDLFKRYLYGQLMGMG